MSRRVRLGDAHDIATGLYAVLSVSSIDLPTSWRIAVAGHDNAGLVHALKIGQGLEFATLDGELICMSSPDSPGLPPTMLSIRSSCCLWSRRARSKLVTILIREIWLPRSRSPRSAIHAILESMLPPHILEWSHISTLVPTLLWS
jgi:hypothetical protein